MEDGQEAMMNTAADYLLPYLPMSIISKILSRLRPRTLGKLKLVCKAWRHLIESPHFVLRQHLPFSRKFRPFILFRRERVILSYATVEINRSNPNSFKLREPVPVRPLSTCNGLLLYMVEMWHRRAGRSFLCVTNPVTRETTPFQSIPCSFYDLRVCQLVFDADVRPWGTYKVLLVYRKEDVTRTAICTLGEKLWAWRSVINPYIYWDYTVGNSTFPERLENPCVEGAIHRICDYRDSNGGKGREELHTFVVAFDIKEEKFRDPIPLPSECRAAVDAAGLVNAKLWHMLQVIELGGLVCLLHFHFANKTLDTWSLTDYGQGKWVKKHCVGLDFLSYESCFTINVFAKVDDERVLMEVIQQCAAGEGFCDVVHTYNLRKEIVKRVADMGLTRPFWGGLFAESLVRITHVQATGETRVSCNQNSTERRSCSTVGEIASLLKKTLMPCMQLPTTIHR